MSEPSCAMRINLYNKKLYDFLERYARKGLFQKDKLRFPPCPGEPEYLVENLSDIGKRNGMRMTVFSLLIGLAIKLAMRRRESLMLFPAF